MPLITAHLDFDSEDEYGLFMKRLALDPLLLALWKAALLGERRRPPRERSVDGIEYDPGDSPIGTLPPRKPQPKQEEPWQLLDGWYSWEHNYFYRQVIRQANAILREAAKDKRGGE